MKWYKYLQTMLFMFSWIYVYSSMRSRAFDFNEQQAIHGRLSAIPYNIFDSMWNFWLTRHRLLKTSRQVQSIGVWIAFGRKEFHSENHLVNSILASMAFAYYNGQYVFSFLLYYYYLSGTFDFRRWVCVWFTCERLCQVELN